MFIIHLRTLGLIYLGHFIYRPMGKPLVSRMQLYSNQFWRTIIKYLFKEILYLHRQFRDESEAYVALTPIHNRNLHYLHRPNLIRTLQWPLLALTSVFIIAKVLDLAPNLKRLLALRQTPCRVLVPWILLSLLMGYFPFWFRYSK